MIYVVLPAYNEAPQISDVLRGVGAALRAQRAPHRIVLVDDGSADGTGDAARRVAREHPETPVTVLLHPTNRGLGAALRTGYAWCLDEAADDDAIVTLDADGTHPPELIAPLVAHVAAGYDLSIASRYAPGAVTIGVPAYRVAVSEAARFLLRLLFPIPGVRDYTCCFRAIRAGVLRRARAVYGEEMFEASGFEAVTDLLLRLQPLGVRAAEVALALDYRLRAGRSKMPVLRSVLRTTALLVRRWRENRAIRTRRIAPRRPVTAPR